MEYCGRKTGLTTKIANNKFGTLILIPYKKVITGEYCGYILGHQKLRQLVKITTSQKHKSSTFRKKAIVAAAHRKYTVRSCVLLMLVLYANLFLFHLSHQHKILGKGLQMPHCVTTVLAKSSLISSQQNSSSSEQMLHSIFFKSHCPCR